jgi:sister-chromatid-cohesion protein PDS5
VIIGTQNNLVSCIPKHVSSSIDLTMLPCSILNICNQITFYFQDSCFQARVQFSKKLHKGLVSLRLPLQFLSIFSLAANDPIKERRIQCKSLLTSNITKRRDFLKQHSAAMCECSFLYNDVNCVLQSILCG